MAEGSLDPNSFEGIVAGLDGSGEVLAADTRVRVQMMPGDGPYDSMAELLDVCEVNIAKGLLRGEAHDAAADFVYMAFDSGDPDAFVVNQLEYEEGPAGLIAVMNFPGAGRE